ncbi:WD-repeat-containing protein [Mucidula mucida]|nr:WD-repeat-containing protein [Mucidula mucida]
MVQSYLRHGPTQAFGLICSSSSNAVYDGKLAYVPALEDVLVWDMKKGQMIAMWHETGHRAEVTCIARSPQAQVFAVGYADGSIRLWNAVDGSVIAAFNGHKKAVSALAFDEQGTRLASGSQDTDLILWDVTAEAGLFRLRGHRDQITCIRFLRPSEKYPSSSNTSLAGFLVTISKDTFLKVWDLATQHCIQTVVAHRSDVWAMDVDPAQELLFTGSGEGEVKAWKINHETLLEGMKETENGEVSKLITPFSDLPLSSTQRVAQISFHPTESYIAIQSHDRSVEVFRIRTEEEVLKKQARRKKRAKEKKDKTGKEATLDEDDSEVKLVDLFTPHVVIRANAKIRSFDFGVDSTSARGGVQILMGLASNALEVYNIPAPSKSKNAQPEATRLFSVDLPGHRTDIRSLSLSSDDQLLASASNGSVKIWNMKTTSCIRTMDCGHAICCTFLPGDRHVAVGTKSGEILLYDVAASALIETISAHSGAVWSLHVRADEKALVSGSAGKDVKFWEFGQKAATESSTQSGQTLTLTHVRTLKMTDDVLAVRYSPNGKLLAVSLLDSTVKVFYQDSLKFFLSLYGHKLPVLSMDISHDSKLIVTCSADKNVKIWGLDFGDCHKSIFAHDESVMQVAFEHQSHYFWTFENIQKLEGHHREVWALALSHHGNFVVTGSHDKSIRVWEKLEDPLFLEEERERELEQLYEHDIADTLNRQNDGEGSTDQAETTAVSKQTAETLMDGERIMEALTLADDERRIFAEYEESPPPRNPVLAAYDLEPEAYVLRVVEKVRSTSLHDALLVLPFGKVVSLMNYLNIWAQKEWNILLVSRILFFLLRTHHHQIVANRVMRTALIPLRKHLRAALRRQKDLIAYNMAALQHMRRLNDDERNVRFFEEEDMDEERIRARISEGKKRKRVALQA